MAFSIAVDGFEETARALAGVIPDLERRLQRAYGAAMRAAVRDATKVVVTSYPRVTGRLRKSLAVVARLTRQSGFTASYRVGLVVSNPGAVYHDAVVALPQHRHLDGFVNRWFNRNLSAYVHRAIAAEFA